LWGTVSEAPTRPTAPFMERKREKGVVEMKYRGVHQFQKMTKSIFGKIVTK